MKRRKMVRIALLAVLVLLIGGIFTVSRKNTAAMNAFVETALEELHAHYTVTQRDPGEYGELKLFGLMKFKVDQYDAEELGNVSVMRVNMGLMQMASVVVTPRDKNLPLFSADYLYMLSNRKAYLEFYDVVKEKDELYGELMESLVNVQDKYTYLDDFEPAEAWYDDLMTVATFKSATWNYDTSLLHLFAENMHVYLEHGNAVPTLSAEERQEKLALTAAYTDGLIEKGGVSTDIFKKQLGYEETKNFFDKVFFGTAIP